MAKDNVNITIIKRKKVIEGGHHGGAWKVAYADFVTAMMAFFLLMWLLSATTEKQRKGIADYFAPTIPISPISAGGDGIIYGEAILSQETLAKAGVGGVEAEQETGEKTEKLGGLTIAGEEDELAELESLLLGRTGESEVADDLLSHIITRVTDEGLVIDVFAKEGKPLFQTGSAAPTEKMRKILTMISEVLALIRNPLQITGHTDGTPFTSDDQDNWLLSADRANAVRRELQAKSVEIDRFRRIVGEADRNLALPDLPEDPRNRRITLTILRSDNSLKN